MALENIKVNNSKVLSISETIKNNDDSLVNCNAICDYINKYRTTDTLRNGDWKKIFNITIPIDATFIIRLKTNSEWARLVICYNEDIYNKRLIDTNYKGNDYWWKFKATSEEITSISYYINCDSTINIETDLILLSEIDSDQEYQLDNYSSHISTLENNYITLKRLSNNIWDTNGPYQYHSELTKEQRELVYKSVLSAKFKNCDKTQLRSIWFIWNNYGGDNRIEFGTIVYNGTTWVGEFREVFENINFSENPVLSLHFERDNKELDLLYDTTILYNIRPVHNGQQINYISGGEIPEYVFSKTCYIDSYVQPATSIYIPKTIRMYPNAKLPVFSFEFDDVCSNDYLFYNLFKSYGYVCGFAFIASEANILNRSEEYLKYQQEGFSILNHSVDGTIFDLTNYTYETAQSAIETAARRLEKAGFVVNGWVSPSSSLASEFLPIIKNHFAYASTFNDSYQNGRNSNPCTTTRHGCYFSTVEEMKSYVDSQIINDKITTFYAHGHDLSDNFTIEDIALVIEYILEKQAIGLCKLMSPDEARQYYFNL